jgi:hypothetical protein
VQGAGHGRHNFWWRRRMPARFFERVPESAGTIVLCAGIRRRGSRVRWPGEPGRLLVATGLWRLANGYLYMVLICPIIITRSVCNSSRFLGRSCFGAGGIGFDNGGMKSVALDDGGMNSAALIIFRSL